MSFIKINNHYNILNYIIFLLSIIFYYRSLKGCSGEFLICAGKHQVRFFIKRAFDLLISIFLFSISILFQIILKLSKINFLIYIITYSLLFYYNQGTDFFLHGTYNCMFFIFIFPICFLYIYLFYLFAYFIYFRKNKNIFFFSILILIHIIIYSYIFKCDKFDVGLGGVKIDNDLNKNACKIIKPQKCGLNILDGLFDVSKVFIKNNCIGYSNQQSIFQKYLNNRKKNQKKYSFPRTENLDIKKTFHNLDIFVEKNIEVINSNNTKDNEIFVNFDNNGKGQIEINLKKNLSLIKSRNELTKKNSVKFNNVYIIYIDGISRNHFLRKLKKTSKLIEKMLHSNKNKEKKYQKFNSFQFLKYHIFNDHSFGNNLPLIYGNYMDKETGISMTKFFKEKGFITASTFNSCNREIFDWDKNYKNFIFTGWDHENFAMFCDTNFIDKKEIWSITKGKNSVLRKCLYGKDSFEYEFEYILQFLEAYKNERKFFKIGFGDAHEGTLEVIKYIDEPLAKFLEIILNKYYDDKTAIFILSDHGAHIPGFHDIFFYKEKTIEKHLATLFIILPENNHNYNKTAITINQQRLITPFDIHDTLLDMINVEKKNYHEMIDKGQSLFKEINGLKRSCKNYDNHIPDDICFCK